MIKLLPVTLVSLALIACDESSSTYWQERHTPTTDTERQMIKEHVERICASWPKQFGDDDPDLEDVVESAHKEARESFCRPTIWEIRRDTMQATGKWHYSDAPESKHLESEVAP